MQRILRSSSCLLQQLHDFEGFRPVDGLVDAQPHAAVADIAATLDDPGTPSQLLPAYAQADGTHFTVAGYAAAATTLTTALTPYM